MAAMQMMTPSTTIICSKKFICAVMVSTCSVMLDGLISWAILALGMERDLSLTMQLKLSSLSPVISATRALEVRMLFCTLF